MADFSLAGLKSFFGNFSRDRSGSVLGVDIGSSAIKVVQLRRERGKAILETYGAIALGPYANQEVGRATNLSAERIGEALKDLMREANVTASDAAISVPYSASLVSMISVPRVPERQLAQMMPIEARKYIPVPIGEVMLDWFVLPDDKPKADAPTPTHMKVLLVAIHNDTLAKYQAIVAAGGLKPSFFEIEVFSTVRSVLDRGIAPTAVLDMGASTTKLYIVERGLVRESHIINRGSQDVTLAISQALGLPVGKAEEEKRLRGLSDPAQAQLVRAIELTLETVIAEVNRSILAFEQHAGASVSKMVMAGGGSALKGLAAYAKPKISTPIEAALPFEKTEAPAFLAEVLSEAGPEFSVAVGLALRRLQEIA